MRRAIKKPLEQLLRENHFEKITSPHPAIDYQELVQNYGLMGFVEVYSFYDQKGNFQEAYVKPQVLRNERAAPILRKINSKKYSKEPLEHQGDFFTLDLEESNVREASQYKIRYTLVRGPKGDETAISPSMNTYITPRTLRRRLQ